MSSCRDCVAGLEHCHGTVVHHTALRAECTEADCVTTEVVHAFSVDCAAAGCTCGVIAVVSASAHRVG